MNNLFDIVFLGFFATLAIDCWAYFSKKFLNMPVSDWKMVGRWVGHFKKGRFAHKSISNALEIKHEIYLGWVFHYSIGIFYAFIFYSTVVLVLKEEHLLLWAWFFGLSTTLSPWLIMQPCLGMGFFASQVSNPFQVRLQNLIIHSIFGLALYVFWSILN